MSSNINSITTLNEKEYERPKKTYTEKINDNKDKIIDKLDDYTQVTDIYKVPLGTHLRYYKNEDGTKKFILGGRLLNNSGLPEYIILTNGKFKWSVQIDTVITFFRKMTQDEIKKDYEDMIEELSKKNDNLKLIIKDQQIEITRLKEKLNSKK